MSKYTVVDVFLQSALSANSEALATVTGIVDGTGSVGAAIGQVIMTLDTGCTVSEGADMAQVII